MSGANTIPVRQAAEDVLTGVRPAITAQNTATDTTPNAEHSSPGYAVVGPGLEAVQQSLAQLRAAFPDADVTVEDAVVDGDKMLVRWTARGTHTGEYAGVSPTGRQVTVTGVDLIRLAGHAAEM